MIFEVLFCHHLTWMPTFAEKTYDALDVFLMGASCDSTTGQLNCDSNFWRACSTKKWSFQSFLQNLLIKGCSWTLGRYRWQRPPRCPVAKLQPKFIKGHINYCSYSSQRDSLCPANLLDTWRSFMILCSGHVLHFLPYDAWHIGRCYFGSCHFNEREREWDGGDVQGDERIPIQPFRESRRSIDELATEEPRNMEP